MAKKSLNGQNCSMALALELLRDRWTLLIVRDAFLKTRSFSGFQSSLGIARNILSERLQHLVTNGILEKRQTRPEVERYTYHLTEKGNSLLPLLVFLMQWGDKWICGAGSEPVVILDKENKAPIQEVALQARDGRHITHMDLTFAPGPGANDVTRERLEMLRAMIEGEE